MKFRLLYIPIITWCFSACISTKDYQQITQENKNLSYSLYHSQRKLIDNKVVHLKEVDQKKSEIYLLQDSCLSLNSQLDSLGRNIENLERFLFVTRIQKRRDSIRLIDRIQSLKNEYSPFADQKKRENYIKDTLDRIKQALFLSLKGTSFTPIE